MLPLFLFALTLVPKEKGIQKITVSSGAAQGEAIVVKIKVNPSYAGLENKFKAHFSEREFPCYKDPDQHQIYTCYVPVPADAKTGKQKIKISLNRKTISNGNVTVRPTKFPVEPLRLNKEKKSLVEKGDSAEQVRRIRKALSTENSEKLAISAYLQPVQGMVESPYGERRTIDGKPRKGYHRGIDWGSKEGTSILSANDGKVILADPFVEEGNMIMIDHGQGVVSAYMHCSQMNVKEGDVVKKGDVIGKVGSTGVATSSHLHFGLYLHGTPINPVYWLSLPE